MDYFQGVVTEYLRADRAMFVNTECCIQLNSGVNPDKSGPHWYCDAVAVNFRLRKVFLCEVSYSKSLSELMTRLMGWANNWGQLKQALERDCSLPDDWEVRPWLFIPHHLHATLDKKLATLYKVSGGVTNMPVPEITELEEVLPWVYKSWNRIPEAKDDDA